MILFIFWGNLFLREKSFVLLWSIWENCLAFFYELARNLDGLIYHFVPCFFCFGHCCEGFFGCCHACILSEIHTNKKLFLYKKETLFKVEERLENVFWVDGKLRLVLCFFIGESFVHQVHGHITDIEFHLLNHQLTLVNLLDCFTIKKKLFLGCHTAYLPP